MDAKRQAAIAKEEAINAQCAKAFFKEHGITLEEWEEIHPKPNVAALVKRANEICPHDPEVEMESARQQRLAKMRAIPLSQEDVDNAGDLTNATFPDIWRAMGEVDIICLGLPFACEFFQDQLSRLVGLPRIVRDYDAMRASYKSFCQQEVKRNGPLAAKIKEGRFTADLDPYLGFKVQRKLHQAMEVKLQEIISVADSSESEEEEEKKESSSEEEEEEEEEEEPELLAIRLRGQYQALSNKLGLFHGPSSVRARLKQQADAMLDRLIGIWEDIPYLDNEVAQCKWLASGKPGLGAIKPSDVRPSGLVVSRQQVRNAMRHEEDDEEMLLKEQDYERAQDHYAFEVEVATCEIVPSAPVSSPVAPEWVRESYVDHGKAADPYLQHMQRQPMCKKIKDKVFFDFWVDPTVDYANPAAVYRIALGMEPDTFEKRVLDEWANEVSRRYKDWAKEPIPEACRGCGQLMAECTCDCECRKRDHTCTYIYRPNNGQYCSCSSKCKQCIAYEAMKASL